LALDTGRSIIVSTTSYLLMAFAADDVIIGFSKVQRLMKGGSPREIVRILPSPWALRYSRDQMAT
jgi:hypothetical protein